MSPYSEVVREEARLLILRSLSEETSGALPSSLLQAGLESWGIHKTREWVHAEIQYLADIGAVQAQPNASVLIVTLMARGLDHVQRRIALPGVKRPSLPGV